MLDECELDAVPEALSGLSALTFLDLSLNQFHLAEEWPWWPNTLSRSVDVSSPLPCECRALCIASAMQMAENDDMLYVHILKSQAIKRMLINYFMSSHSPTYARGLFQHCNTGEASSRNSREVPFLRPELGCRAKVYTAASSAVLEEHILCTAFTYAPAHAYNLVSQIRSLLSEHYHYCRAWLPTPL